ncbi:MAG TPA: hypothetical protein VN922_21520, partial [Bacteroidia bacterium]|nr:hypothetical protein [Bacteroidia bacterium]
NWKTRSRTQQFERNVGDFFSSFGHGLGNLIGGIVKGILAFIGVILVIILTCLLLVLVMSLFTGMNVINIESHNGHMLHYSVHNIFNMFNISGGERTLLLVGAFLFLGIPLISLIIRFGRAISGRKRPFQWYNVSASVLWTAAWIFIIIGIAKVSQHFKVPAHVSSETTFTLPAPTKTLYLKIPVQNNEDDISIGIDSHNFYVSDDTVFFGSLLLNTSPSPDSNFHFILNKSARGTNAEEAKTSANNIEYSFAQHDSVLQLSSYYQLSDGASWRMQKLEGTLEIPANKTVDMPEGIDHFIYSSIHHKHRHLGGHRWLMTNNGLANDTLSTSKNK